MTFTEGLQGDYDIIIATDVFEHVPDPLALAHATADHLCVGGRFLTANCFYPVIRCHLPQTFHFRYTWDSAIVCMGLGQTEPVCYGQAFTRKGQLDLNAARRIGTRTRKLWKMTQHLPYQMAKPLTTAFLTRFK